METQNPSQYQIQPEILIISALEQDRQLLQEMLGGSYRLLFEEDGDAGMKLLRKNRKKPVLVLLDVSVPGCDAEKFLKADREDPFLKSVPVVALTDRDDPETEETCVRLGAMDFIRKPWQEELVLGRLKHILHYCATLSTLSEVEYDALTGLYTMPAFCHYAGLFRDRGNSTSDLIMVSIRDYAAINRTYGEKKSTELVRHIAGQLKELMPQGLTARQEGSFYILASSEDRLDRPKMTEVLGGISASAPIQNVRLRAGIYQKVEQELPISVLCDRAKLGMFSAVGDSNVSVAYFDEKLEQQWIRHQKLLLSFEPALRNHEFRMYLQPKVEISSGKVTAAEALVRWQAEDGELIAPGAFIPMLEQEDMIRKLDEYMFREVCEHQRRQRAAGKQVVPISVNLSRCSLFSDGIIEKFRKIAAETETELNLVPLEVTESALISDLQIQKICDEFVEAGFLLQIDDFGSGYSSLSSLAALPFSELKIDKTLSDNIGTKKGNILVKSAVQIAMDLGMTVIAEGIEREEQVKFLQEVRCNMIQGFYFAQPMTPEEFEALLAAPEPFEEKRRQNPDAVLRTNQAELNRYLQALGSVFCCIRILEPGMDIPAVVKSGGMIRDENAPCYALWNRQERCRNCTSRQAFEERCTMHKVETVNDRQYQVYSVYLEVDGQPRVIEMVGPLGQN